MQIKENIDKKHILVPKQFLYLALFIHNKMDS